ncbi:MAG: hypothetical protein PHX91_01790 [Prevotella sp.]|nr:hypothetical protein [Prevotella sp.]
MVFMVGISVIVGLTSGGDTWRYVHVAVLYDAKIASSDRLPKTIDLFLSAVARPLYLSGHEDAADLSYRFLRRYMDCHCARKISCSLTF